MLIHVKVSAGEKRESLEALSDTRFAVSVRQKAERNEANERVLKMLADYFHVPYGKARIVSGHHSPSKIVEIKNEARP